MHRYFESEAKEGSELIPSPNSWMGNHLPGESGADWKERAFSSPH
jgi:hypothetical protein